MNYYIITTRIFNLELKKFNIGGIQTYIQSLYALISSKGHNVFIVQFCSCQKEELIRYDHINVLLIPLKKSFFKSSMQATFDFFYKRNNQPNSHFIIDTDQYDICSKGDNVTQIQHGIAFDIPGNMIKGFWGKAKLFQHVYKILVCLKNSRRLYNTRNTVCVDYNFYNWFRTLGTIYSGWNIKVIPNFSSGTISQSELSAKLEMNDKTVRVLFARRFFDYRGTLIMIEAVKKILEKYDNAYFTFAGGGPLEQAIIDSFKDNEKVTLTSFKPDESVHFHKKYDIAVVPTIFSEGTSLSLSEAMSAGCVVIATHVGGMTNMILDSFNGFLIEPSADSLIKKLEYVITMPIDEKRRIIRNAYESSLYSFSKAKWCNQWLEYLHL